MGTYQTAMDQIADGFAEASVGMPKVHTKEAIPGRHQQWKVGIDTALASINSQLEIGGAGLHLDTQAGALEEKLLDVKVTGGGNDRHVRTSTSTQHVMKTDIYFIFS